MIHGLLLFAAAGISVSEAELATYPFSDPDPVPAVTERRYPYFRYDGSTAVPTRRRWTQVALENARTRVVVMPEVGGKVWSATDKVAGRDFLYCNHVMKFRDIAMRGPWLSGGIEFNFGIIGHAPSSATPVDWFVRTNADASVSCFVASAEYVTRAWWQVEIRLGPDDEGFETRTTWYNASGLAQPYYHWMNAAFPVAASPEFHYPGTASIGHQGEIDTRTWPRSEDGKRRLSDYAQNDFGGAKSYHVINGNNGFFGIWWKDIGYGACHRNDPTEKYGRKLFFWALSREGAIWEDLLTDADGQYAELQSGRAFNQPRYLNYLSPFKHPTFAPGSCERFVDRWEPVRDETILRAEGERPMPVPRSIDAAEGFDWTTAYGLYRRGEQALRERDERTGRENLEKALAKEPNFVPALTALAGYQLRRGNHAAVHELCRRAERVDIYDAEANYLDGYAFFVEGDTTSARERLGVAAFHPEFRSAANALVARSCLKDGDRAGAEAAARKALAANDANLDAELVLLVAGRGQPGAAARARRLLERYPLFHAARYELHRADGKTDFSRYVTNELTDETWLELGSWYAETGLSDDAANLFARAGGSLVARLRLGDYAGAKALSVAGVFPFRREELPVLDRAVREDGHWKFRYLKAVLLASFQYDDEADALLDGCGNGPDEATFYLFRATRRKGAARLADLRRAAALGDSWRVGRALVRHFDEEGDFESALEEARRYRKACPDSDPLKILLARELCRTRRFRECLDSLKDVTVLPSEHRDSATEYWHEAQKALGLPLTWPEGLGRGKPFEESR